MSEISGFDLWPRPPAGARHVPSEPGVYAWVPEGGQVTFRTVEEDAGDPAMERPHGPAVATPLGPVPVGAYRGGRWVGRVVFG